MESGGGVTCAPRSTARAARRSRPHRRSDYAAGARRQFSNDGRQARKHSAPLEHAADYPRGAGPAPPSAGTCFSTVVAAPIMDATSLRLAGTISVLPAFARLPKRSR